jgi:hypothetical protein
MFLLLPRLEVLLLEVVVLVVEDQLVLEEDLLVREVEQVHLVQQWELLALQVVVRMMMELEQLLCEDYDQHHASG